MSRTVSLSLDQVQIASPCPVRWEEMTGDDTKRHCARCDLDVHNLSAMTRDQAEELLASHTGRLCAGFYRRPDGTILTRECPVGLRLARERLVRLGSRIAAAVGLLLTGGILIGASGGVRAARLHRLEPFATIRGWLSLDPPQIPYGGFLSGAIRCPPAPGSSTPAPNSGGASASTTGQS